MEEAMGGQRGRESDELRAAVDKQLEAVVQQISIVSGHITDLRATYEREPNDVDYQKHLENENKYLRKEIELQDERRELEHERRLLESQKTKLADRWTWTDWITEPLPGVNFVYDSRSGASGRHNGFQPNTVRKWENFQDEIAAHIHEFSNGFKDVKQQFHNKLDVNRKWEQRGDDFTEEVNEGWLRSSEDFRPLQQYEFSTHGDVRCRIVVVVQVLLCYAPFLNWKFLNSASSAVTVKQKDRGAEPPAGASTQSEPSALASDEPNAAESSSDAAAHATDLASDRKFPDISVKNDQGHYCVVIECKRPSVMRTNADAEIPDLVTTKAPVLKEAIRQVVKYINSKRVGYAILTSDDLTYCFRVVGDILEISDGLTRTHSLKAFQYILFLSKVKTNVPFHAYGAVSSSVQLKRGGSASESTGDEQHRGKKTKQGQGTGDASTQETRDLQEMQVQNLHLGESPYATGSSGNLVLGYVEGQQVAIKLAPADDPRAEMLLREAKIYLRLQDLWGTVVPTLVRWGSTVNGTLVYLATEFVEGLTLEQALITEEVKVATLQALAAVHAHGILHGDIHARNILVAKTGVRIIDFGLSEHNSCPLRRREELEELYSMLSRRVRRVGFNAVGSNNPGVGL